MCVPWITRNLSVFSPCPCSPAFLRLRVGVAFVIPSQEARNLLLLFRALNSRLIIGSRLNWFLLSDHPIAGSPDSRYVQSAFIWRKSAADLIRGAYLALRYFSRGISK
jgi:hypothetical protein